MKKEYAIGFFVALFLLYLIRKKMKTENSQLKTGAKKIGKLGKKDSSESFIEQQDWFNGTKSLIDVKKEYKPIFDFLVDEEGLSEKAIWDVNAWRIGYGSDTITTRLDGDFRKVKQGDTTTDKLAQKDLERRLRTDFPNVLKRQFGEEVYNSFPMETKVALNSMAYNYGSITKPKIREAVKKANKGDMTWERVSEIWKEETVNDNKKLSERMRKALFERRKREAEIIKHSGEYDG